MKKYLIAWLLAAAPAPALAQLSITAEGTPVTADFTGFRGYGLAPGGGTGRLDSNVWSIRGASDGDTLWGLGYELGDYAHADSAGGVSAGGVYAFYAGASDDASLGVQPTEGDFTPGGAVLRLRNDTGRTLTRLDVSFEAWSYNDGDRAVSFVLGYSIDDVTWIDTTTGATTLLAADVVPAWTVLPMSTTLGAISIAPGGHAYLRWYVADAGGGGARDEVAVDDIRVTAYGGAAMPDAGPSMTDAGPIERDAGAEPDAAVTRDAGPGSDSGEVPPGDGGTVRSDAGGVPIGPPRTGRRSGCSATDGTPAPLAPLGVAWLILWARRRSR